MRERLTNESSEGNEVNDVDGRMVREEKEAVKGG